MTNWTMFPLLQSLMLGPLLCSVHQTQSHPSEEVWCQRQGDGAKLQWHQEGQHRPPHVLLQWVEPTNHRHMAVCSFHSFLLLFLVLLSDTEAKGTSDRLSEERLSAMVNKPALVKMTDRHRPSGTWAFWYPESEMDKTELETGQEVRLKTRGNSPFICESLNWSSF